MIAVDAFLTDSTRRADVFLPCTLWGEKTGTVTNLEGRVQRVGRKVAPEGTAMDDWRIAVELALRLGRDFDFATVDEVTDEIARVAPAFGASTPALLRRARDGVVLPLREHRDEIVLRTRELSILADDGSGTSWDPIKVEGEAAGRCRRATKRPAASVGRRNPRSAAAARARAARVGPRRVPTASVPPRDAYALRLVVGRRLYDNGRMVERDARVRRGSFPTRAADQPARPRPRSASRPATEVKVTSAAGVATRPVVGRSPACPSASRASTSPPTAPARRCSSTRRTRHRPARGDAAMNPVLALDPLFNGGDMTWSVFAVVLIKVVIAFVLLLVSVMLYIWGMRKVIADMQNRIGPNRAGPYGVLQTLADGIKLFFKEQSIPTSADRPVFRLAPYLSILPAFLMFCIVPIGGDGVDPRSPHVPAGRRPADRRAVHPRDVGPRRVRRDARGLVVGLEVPAARLGALDRAAALVRSRVRSRDPRRAHPGGHAVDARDRRPAGVARAGTSFVDATGSGSGRSCRSGSS